jgi:hypothetical protein
MQCETFADYQPSPKIAYKTLLVDGPGSAD